VCNGIAFQRNQNVQPRANPFSRARRILSVVVGEEGEHAAREASSCLARLYHCDGHTVLTADNSAENRAWLRARFPGKDLQPASAACVQAAIVAACGDTLRTEAV
jgi:hypothetical protein